MTDKTITAPDATAAPAVRTFRSVVEGLRIGAAAKRELLALHDREVDAARGRRCDDPTKREGGT